MRANDLRGMLHTLARATGHGHASIGAKNAFVAMTTPNQTDLIAFLNNFVLFKIPEG